MRELCCSIVSTLVFRLFFLFIIFQFGVAGATLGAIAGTVIGWSNKKRLIKDVIVGVLYGITLSYKLTKATFDHLLSNDADSWVFLVHIVKIITGALEKMLCHDEHIFMGFIKAPFGKSYSLADFFQSLKQLAS